MKHRCTFSVFCVLTYSQNALGSNGNYHNSHAFYDCDFLQPNLKLTIGKHVASNRSESWKWNIVRLYYQTNPLDMVHLLTYNNLGGGFKHF